MPAVCGHVASDWPLLLSSPHSSKKNSQLPVIVYRVYYVCILNSYCTFVFWVCLLRSCFEIFDYIRAFESFCCRISNLPCIFVILDLPIAFLHLYLTFAFWTSRLHSDFGLIFYIWNSSFKDRIPNQPSTSAPWMYFHSHTKNLPAFILYFRSTIYIPIFETCLLHYVSSLSIFIYLFIHHDYSPSLRNFRLTTRCTDSQLLRMNHKAGVRRWFGQITHSYVYCSNLVA